MKGHHEVREFRFKAGDTFTLPEGWKPFAASLAGYWTIVVARKWVRTEPAHTPDDHTSEGETSATYPMEESGLEGGEKGGGSPPPFATPFETHKSLHTEDFSEGKMGVAEDGGSPYKGEPQGPPPSEPSPDRQVYCTCPPEGEGSSCLACDTMSVKEAIERAALAREDRAFIGTHGSSCRCGACSDEEKLAGQLGYTEEERQAREHGSREFGTPSNYIVGEQVPTGADVRDTGSREPEKYPDAYELEARHLINGLIDRYGPLANKVLAEVWRQTQPPSFPLSKEDAELVCEMIANGDGFVGDEKEANRRDDLFGRLEDWKQTQPPTLQLSEAEVQTLSSILADFQQGVEWAALFRDEKELIEKVEDWRRETVKARPTRHVE